MYFVILVFDIFVLLNVLMLKVYINNLCLVLVVLLDMDVEYIVVRVKMDSRFRYLI